MDTVVVTRHTGLVDFLRQEKIIDESTPVLAHVTADLVRDKHVIGVLPIILAAEAAKVTVVALDIPQERRGQELTAEDCRAMCTGIHSYVVDRVT